LKRIRSKEIKYIVILIFGIIFSLSCSSSESSEIKSAGELPDSSRENLYAIARSRYESNFKLIYNQYKDFIICKKFNEEEIGKNLLLDYFLYDLNSGEVIFEDKIPNGNIYWLKQYAVRVEEIPGVMKTGVVQPIPGYTFDVKKRKKIKFSQE
jgi:hypothetical protein